MQTGTVKFYNSEKAFGFITPDDGSKDVFVHKNGIRQGMLDDGTKVQYETENTAKGLNAIEVEVIGQSPFDFIITYCKARLLPGFFYSCVRLIAPFRHCLGIAPTDVAGINHCC